MWIAITCCTWRRHSLTTLFLPCSRRWSFLSGIVAYIPIPNLFDQILQLMGRFVPADGMVLIKRVLSDVISPNRGTFLSLGLLGTLWTASGGFVATIEALNIAYEVEETRPFWKTRLLGIGLTFLIGFLLLTALAVMIVGPHFGEWLADQGAFVVAVRGGMAVP